MCTMAFCPKSIPTDPFAVSLLGPPKVINRKTTGTHYKNVIACPSCVHWIEGEAPEVGFEPTTDRLTADCSAVELFGKIEQHSVPIYYQTVALLSRFGLDGQLAIRRLMVAVVPCFGWLVMVS